MRERLVKQIHNLMLTQPDKQWSYDELAKLLNSRKKIICSRCLDLYNLDLIDKVLVESGKLRGRAARVSIKKPQIDYPSWLCTNGTAAETAKVEVKSVIKHRLGK